MAKDISARLIFNTNAGIEGPTPSGVTIKTLTAIFYKNRTLKKFESLFKMSLDIEFNQIKSTYSYLLLNLMLMKFNSKRALFYTLLAQQVRAIA